MVEFGPRWIYQPKCDYGQTVIKVVVGAGDNEKTFAVHKNLLCAISAYFERVLNCPSFIDSQEMTVTLNDDIASTFEVLQCWAYSGKVDHANSYTGGGDLPEDQFWLRVYRLADFLQVRAVQVIAFERFETVFPCTKPIVLPSKTFLKELYGNGASPQALQVYVAGHTAYWMLRVPSKASRWATLLASQPCYGMDTATVLAKLLPLQMLDPEGLPRAHPAYRRGSFAVDHGLDLVSLRREANDRIVEVTFELVEVTVDRPELGTSALLNIRRGHAKFKLETIIESQPLQFEGVLLSSPPSPRRRIEDYSARESANPRPKKKAKKSVLAASLVRLAAHTVDEARL